MEWREVEGAVIIFTRPAVNIWRMEKMFKSTGNTR